MVSPGVLGYGQPHLSRRHEAHDVCRVGRERVVVAASDACERLVDRGDPLLQAPGRDSACADVGERTEVRFRRVAARIAVEQRFARAPADEQWVPLVEEAGAWRTDELPSLRLEQAVALADLCGDRGKAGACIA